MNLMIACDSFKGSLTSLGAGNAIKRGILKADPHVTATVFPLADGGEGTVDAFVHLFNGTHVTTTVTGPLGAPVDAQYGWVEAENTAIVETAAASGLPLIASDQLDPWNATSYGTGELIQHALHRGAKRIIVGLGGSATVDGGMGLMQALGVIFYDEKGAVLDGKGASLHKVASLDRSALAVFQEIDILLASDVTNPLIGQTGAAQIFGPQKGLAPVDIPKMDKALTQYASVIQRALHLHGFEHLSGSGAAGGIGFALQAFLNAQLESGFKRLIDASQLIDQLKKADVIITGEGQLDDQSFYGKVPVSLAKEAAPYGIPVIAFAGKVLGDPERFADSGIHAAVPITNGPLSLAEAMQQSEELLSLAAERTWRLIHTFL
ncbi:glycerate kinase [Bacillaceae bacterium SIJ1]|uniref:glycerate kinase family protein n=1 Tax=Litoribacterium kuwaitense TaxID=1398745 RepID=UPI0013EC1CFA|nr:glycerate kinase [Litoribacterium kuwaitense]NGP46483.1 glycerate kinase [Litoribacterium kuwaitense]